MSDMSRIIAHNIHVELRSTVENDKPIFDDSFKRSIRKLPLNDHLLDALKLTKKALLGYKQQKGAWPWGMHAWAATEFTWIYEMLAVLAQPISEFRALINTTVEVNGVQRRVFDDVFLHDVLRLLKVRWNGRLRRCLEDAYADLCDSRRSTGVWPRNVNAWITKVFNDKYKNGEGSWVEDRAASHAAQALPDTAPSRSEPTLGDFITFKMAKSKRRSPGSASAAQQQRTGGDVANDARAGGCSVPGAGVNGSNDGGCEAASTPSMHQARGDVGSDGLHEPEEDVATEPEVQPGVQAAARAETECDATSTAIQIQHVCSVPCTGTGPVAIGAMCDVLHGGGAGSNDCAEAEGLVEPEPTIEPAAAASATSGDVSDDASSLPEAGPAAGWVEEVPPEWEVEEIATAAVASSPLASVALAASPSASGLRPMGRSLSLDLDLPSFASHDVEPVSISRSFSIDLGCMCSVVNQPAAGFSVDLPPSAMASGPVEAAASSSDLDARLVYDLAQSPAPLDLLTPVAFDDSCWLPTPSFVAADERMDSGSLDLLAVYNHLAIDDEQEVVDWMPACVQYQAMCPSASAEVVADPEPPVDVLKLLAEAEMVLQAEAVAAAAASTWGVFSQHITPEPLDPLAAAAAALGPIHCPQQLAYSASDMASLGGSAPAAFSSRGSSSAGFSPDTSAASVASACGPFDAGKPANSEAGVVQAAASFILGFNHVSSLGLTPGQGCTVLALLKAASAAVERGDLLAATSILSGATSGALSVMLQQGQH